MGKPVIVRGGHGNFVRYSIHGTSGVKQGRVGVGGHGEAPVRWGLWVFTEGYEEYGYFANGAIQAAMKKPANRYDGITDGGWEAMDAIDSKLFRQAARSIRRVIRWNGPVYSCIAKNGEPSRHPDFGGEWTLYPSPVEYAKVANKYIVKHSRTHYDPNPDYFECFLPGKKF